MSDELLRDFSKRYWDSANVIAGFGAAQSLAFLFAFTGNCVVRAAVLHGVASQILTVAAVLASLVIYAVLLQRCHNWEQALLTQQASMAPGALVLKASKRAKSARIAVVAGFHAVLALVLLLAIFTTGPGPGCTSASVICPP